MALTYSIRDWSQHFESYEQSRSKLADGMKWVRVTTKHDGKTFRRLSRLDDAAAIYGAWILIVAIAGKCPVRGVLADGDGPLTPNDMELKTGFPASAFARAIEVLSSDEFRWLDANTSDGENVAKSRDSPTSCGDSRRRAGVPADVRESPSRLDQTTPQEIRLQETIPQEPKTGGVLKKRFSLWKKATREQILRPSGAQRVFQLATEAGICTADERVHVFRLICSLHDASGNLPGILTTILRGTAGGDPWRARGIEWERQARDWIRQLDVPPEMCVRTSDLSVPDRREEYKRELLLRDRRSADGGK